MRKFYAFLMAMLFGVSGQALANFEYPTGSGIYYDIDNTDAQNPVAFVQWVDSPTGDVTIPNTVEYDSKTYTVTYFGEYGKFSGKTAVTSVSIPSTITAIPASCFYGCSGLTSVILPSTITSIGAYAYQNCTALTSVTIPASVTSIGNSAFQGCDNITSLTFEGTTPPTIGDQAFSTSADPWYWKNCIINVPDGATSNYNSQSVYYYFPDIYNAHHFRESASFTIGTTGYATYYNTYGYTMPDGVEGYVIDWTSDGYANIQKVYEAGDAVCDNIALLLKSTNSLSESKTFNFTVLASGGNTASWPTYDYEGTETNRNNYLHGTQTETTTVAPLSSNFFYYKLANDATNGLGWYWGANDGGTFTNEAHKAYLTIEQNSSSAASKFISMFNNGTTAINKVETVNDDAGNIYTISGVKVNPSAIKHGVYIKNGKKYIKK